MIGYLRGEVLENTEGALLVLIGRDGAYSGVGYSVSVPQGPAYLNFLPGKQIELFVHTHVREDALDLYGFATRAEKEIFLTLLGVNGIGPKVAMAILTKVEPVTLIQAILESDSAALTRIPGIGKKTAERLILELADKIRKKMESGAFGGMSSSVAGGTGRVQPLKSAVSSGARLAVSPFDDAKDALVGLGYREQDATALLNRILAEADTPPKKAEDLVRSALRQLI